MKTLYIHIGRGKTGTTAQQRALAAHREALLDQGIDYILAGDEGKGGGHQDFAKSFIAERPTFMVPPKDPEALRAETARQIVASPCGTVLLSSENFPLVDIASLKAWIEDLGVIDAVKIILFVRSQDELVESEYNQMVKVTFETSTPAQYAAKAEGMDFFAEAEAWAAHFGRENIIARLFDGRGSHAVAQLGACLPGAPDLPHAPGTEGRQASNRALGARALTVARLLNWSGVTDRLIRHPLFNSFDGKDIPAVLFDAEEAHAIRARFSESNRRFAETYLGTSCDGDLGGRRYDDATRDRLYREAQALYPQQDPAAVAKPPEARDVPKLEYRIPISPNDGMMRMVRYFLESVQEFGGPIGKAAHCALIVGDDQPPFDLHAAYPWMKDHDISVHWVEPENFRRWRFHATGFERFWTKSDADVVALIDADILVGGDFDDVVLRAHRDQTILGVIAHVSPFGRSNLDGRPSADWWQDIFDAAGVPLPPLDLEYTAWGIDFASIPDFAGTNIIYGDPGHRYGPAYYNAGMVIGPRSQFELMGTTFVEDLTLVRKFNTTAFIYQIAHPLCCARHGLRCETISVNYNFPLNLPTDTYRALNPDPDGQDSHEDIRFFHYITGGKYIADQATMDDLIENDTRDGAWPVFRDRLRRTRDRIATKDLG